ncbi:MAG: HAD family hydrolase, partial [Coriobacteriaceae bacterium]|nr:HAD family hydrolase [Coriobacteriaceae bacterium]
MLAKPAAPKAAIFDFDGTIAETEALSMALVADVLRSYGIEPTKEELDGMVGNDDAVTVPPILARATRPVTFDDYLRDLDDCRETYYRTPLVPFDGALEFIERLREQGIKCAIASSTSAFNVVMALNRLRMTTLFDVVVCGDMVEHLKPEPDVYLLALENLGVEAGECIAYEDSPSGIAAAHAAGIYTVAYTGSVV